MGRFLILSTVTCLVLGCGVDMGANEKFAAQPAAEVGGDRVDKAAGSDAQSPTVARKIIYTANVDLVVEDLSTVEAEISKLVKSHGGYLADASIDSRQGDSRIGHWTARIPIDKFDAFLEAVAKLGVPERRTQNAQDVTEEYVDLEARIANKKRLEERILALLDSTDGEIKDVIEVERELARVRGEIEQMEGRLKFLANQTALTTVTITAREERDYVPPQAPGFVSRLGQAWSGSLGALWSFAQLAVLVVVAAFPWIVALAIPLTPAVWYIQRRRGRNQPATLTEFKKS